MLMVASVTTNGWMPRHERAVHEAHEPRAQDRDQRGRRRGEAAPDQRPGREHVREREHRPDREVDPAREDHERHPDRQDAVLRHLPEHVRQVLPAIEDRETGLGMSRGDQGRQPGEHEERGQQAERAAGGRSRHGRHR
jgi:hypothetical protein